MSANDFTWVVRSDIGKIRRVLATMSIALCLSTARAQNCAGDWLSGHGASPMQAGTNGYVYCVQPLRSGEFMAGGSFLRAGSTSAFFIAKWNGTDWIKLGQGLDNYANAIVELSSGDIIVGGYFTHAGSGYPASGGVDAKHIAKWNGSAWQALGAGMNGEVHALATLPNGDLVAGGEFSTAGDPNTKVLARWNGSSWSALGGGVNDVVYALATMPNGDLIVGGGFVFAGGVRVNGIARWDGTTWHALGSGVSGPLTRGIVYALKVLQNGDLIAGGGFTAAGGNVTNRIARWDGANWFPIGAGMNNPVEAISVLPNGDLVAAGAFVFAEGNEVNYVARWNGTHWTSLGLGANSSVAALATLSSGELVAGGYFTRAGEVDSNYIARWSDTNIPWVASHPQSVVAKCGESKTLSVTPASGYSNISYQWRRNMVPIDQDNEHFTVMNSPSGGTLTISDIGSGEAGSYNCLVFNSCGGTSSNVAMLGLSGSCCPADLTGDGLVEDADFEVFVFAYNILECGDVMMPLGCPADLDGDEFVDDSDFSIFVVAYNALVCG